MTPETTKFLTAREVCFHLEVTLDKLLILPIPRYRLPGCYLYASGDVEAFVSGKPIQPPEPVNTDKVLTRDELAAWLRHHTGSIKRWGWQGCGPVFKRGDRTQPSCYPVEQVAAWLLARRQSTA